MPPTGTDPIGVLVQIRDLLAEMLGQLHHEAQEESRKDAERDLEREKERARELGEGTPVPDRPERHKPPEPAAGAKEPDQDRRQRWRLEEERAEARKDGEKGKKDSFEATTGLLGALGMGEVASLLVQMRDAGKAVQEFLGFGESSKTLEQSDPRRLVPEAPPRPEPPPLAEPGLTPVPHNLPTVEQAEPLPDLPSPLTPEGHDPRRDALPDLPTPLVPEATPPSLPDWLADRDEPPTIANPPAPLTPEPAIPQKDAPPDQPRPLTPEGPPTSLPDWLRDRDDPATVQPGPQLNDGEPQPQRRETTLGGGAPTMLAPQPGQGTTALAGPEEDEDVTIGQTVPLLAPGPTPATPPAGDPDADQHRLAVALEKLVALLQREAGSTGDNDDDETEQSENVRPRSLWQQGQAGHGGGHQSAEPGQHQATEQARMPTVPAARNDPLEPRGNGVNMGQATAAVQAISRFFGR